MNLTKRRFAFLCGLAPLRETSSRQDAKAQSNAKKD